MNKRFVAKASLSIPAPIARVWNVLIDPEMIRQYLFGTEVNSDWKEGSPIEWKGVWEGKAYEDKGVILKLNPPGLLQFTRFSTFAGLPEKPENYRTVTCELAEDGKATLLSISQDNNPTEKKREESAKTWARILNGIKLLVKD